MSGSRSSAGLPDDIDSCSALAGELLRLSTDLLDSESMPTPPTAHPLAVNLATDTALLAGALAEYAHTVRTLRRSSGRHGPGEARPELDHRVVTEMGRARSRLRGAALIVGGAADLYSFDA